MTDSIGGASKQAASKVPSSTGSPAPPIFSAVETQLLMLLGIGPASVPPDVQHLLWYRVLNAAGFINDEEFGRKKKQLLAQPLVAPVAPRPPAPPVPAKPDPAVDDDTKSSSKSKP